MVPAPTRTHGPAYAAAADAIAIAAGWLGLLKSALLGRLHSHVPNFLRDLLRHSALRGASGAPHVAPPRFD